MKPAPRFNQDKFGLEKIVINADDFGWRPSVNKAIIKLLDTQLINSTTLMANMPGFEEAVELAHNNRIINQIGAHLVLTEGSPLTEEIKQVDFLFNKRINSSKLFIKKLFFINKNHQNLIFKEYSAQIDKIRKNGIPITHLDTHHQVHDMLAINRIIRELLRTYQIKYMRILNNLEKSEMHKNIYRYLINSKLKKNRVNFTDYFGSQSDFQFRIAKDPQFIKNKRLEIMVHPDYDSEGKIIDTMDKKEYDFNYLKLAF